MANNKFEEKRIEAEVLSELYENVARKEQDVHEEYTVIGKSEEQDKDWRTGDLLWEDEEKTIPKMKDKYGTVEKTELSEEDELKIRVYKRIMAALEKML